MKKRHKKILWGRVILLLLIMFAVVAVIAAAVYGILYAIDSGTDIKQSIAAVFTKQETGKERVQKLEQVQIPDWIDVRLLDVDGKSRSGEKLKDINAIVIHYVGNPNTTAQANRNFFNMEDTEVSSHFVVGLDGEIIQCLPIYERAVASNNRNGDTIAIEVCHPDESGKFNQKTYDSLVKLAAWLCKECGFKNRKNIIRHYDVVGKLCPLYYVEHKDAWVKLQKDILAAAE